MLVFATLAMALVVTGVSSSLFMEYSKNQHTKIVEGAAKLAAQAIDADMVSEYIKKGDAAEGYTETEKQLTAIRENTPDIEYVYVYKIEKDGCHVVFDLDTAELKGADPGEVIPFDKSFMEYIPSLLKGERIDPIETDDTYGWLLTAYEPVYDSKGNCVCYAAADEKVRDMREYGREFAIKVILLFFGFFILILVIGLWLAKYHVILPINSMASLANRFARSEEADNEDMMEENYKRIRELDIRTGDEVQELYESFSKMTEDTVMHVRDIREQSKEIQDLQNGLIVTMADIVEGRDLAAYHHEKWNGEGYPEGLAGEEIPLPARVMAVADVFDALSSKRIYKDAMPFEKAVSIIQKDSGTHFDPKCVEAFTDSLDEIKKVLDYYIELEKSGHRVKGREAGKKDGKQ